MATTSTSPRPTALRLNAAELAPLANRIRRDVIRMVHGAGCGHPGGPLGLAEVFAALYFHEAAVDPQQPDHPLRDRVVLSNGHCCAGLYSVLARRGFFATTELATFRRFGGRLQGHPHRGHLPGVDMSTGSLGTGLSAAAGMALAARLDGSPSRVYAISSDGESQEGQVWENATSAAHHRLGNLTVLLDWNGIQIDGRCAQVMDPRDLGAKYTAFGWHVQEVDGHDPTALVAALAAAREVADQPSLIACRTVIGKGVSFMEDRSDFHGKAPDDAQARLALQELGDPNPDDLDHQRAALWD